MNSVWSNKWKKCLIWFSAYMSFIAFALVGGYVIVKNDDEELKKTTKIVFVVSLVFAAVSGLITIFYNIANRFDSFYNSTMYDVYSIFNMIVNVAKILVFGIFIILELTKKEENN